MNGAGGSQRFDARSGMQDKRLAIASAYRTGRAEEFWCGRSIACCRLNKSTRGFQSFERRLSSGDVAWNIEFTGLFGKCASSPL
jgi:hypothetical protein